MQFIEDMRHPFTKRVNVDTILSSANPSLTLQERVHWLQDLVTWLRAPIQAEERDSLKLRGSGLQTVRIRFLLHLFGRRPDWRAQVATTLRSILTETSGLELFSSTGLTSEAGFFSEVANRIASRVLPTATDERDLATLFKRIFSDESDADWIAQLPADLFSQLVELICDSAASTKLVFLPMQNSMAESLTILGTHLAATGLSPELRARMSVSDVMLSPFVALSRRLHTLADGVQQHVLSDEQARPLINGCMNDISACRDRLNDIRLHLEKSGVSVALVYKIQSLSDSLTRVETILNILYPESQAPLHANTQTFLAALIRQSLEARSVRHLIKVNLDMMARKVVERVGVSGERYIATSRSEYWTMFRAGAGGGVLTVWTTVAKFVITKAHLAMFFEGFFSWLNYSSSFLAMQWFHFALATKQPSMTASALANKLRRLSKRKHLQDFVDEVARITRSQFSAAFGNVGLVVPCALLFDFGFRMLSGHPVLNTSYAVKTINSLDPFSSLTIPAAAFTGVILWVSSLTGGWLENWAVYRRFPEAIETHRRLQWALGERQALLLSQKFARSIAGIGSTICLGFLLAFAPIAGQFFGLPLDIRHVTLSSGSLAFAASSLGWENLNGQTFALACVGIIFILIMNFGVSFALALVVALRARRIKRAWVVHLVRSVGYRLRTRPGDFFLPGRQLAADNGDNHEIDTSSFRTKS